MHFSSIILPGLTIFALVVAMGGILIFTGLRHAPSAIEDETGFHAIKGSTPEIATSVRRADGAAKAHV